MKKLIGFCCFVLALHVGVYAQDAKTNLSLQVSAAAKANRVQLASYVWTRTTQIFIGGELKNTIVSSLSIGPDGKMVTTAVSSTPTSDPPTRGIRGAVAKNKIDDLKTYIDEAMKISMGYLYMSQGKMVDFFNAAGISQSGTTITVSGSNVNQANDQAILLLNSTSLAYISESFKSAMSGGDVIGGTVNYKTFDNGLTAIDNATLDLPAKTMKIMMSSSNYAKKLQ
jgi:hypothetical protein